MMPSIFLSHNSRDKEFVRKLEADLTDHGIKCWLDETHITIGDSLIQKIREGIDDVNYFAIVLSPNSVNAPWVINELDVAMNYQVLGKSIKVLPILLADCELPSFLVGKLYADFRNSDKYNDSLKNLLKSMSVVFNKNILTNSAIDATLGSAIDKALRFNLPIFHKPFHRPFQYLGRKADNLSKELNAIVNEVGNIVVEDDECRMFIEVEGSFVSFIDIDIKRTAPHFLNKEFDSESILGALSIGLHELELVRKQVHYHTYYDHRRKIKVSVSCIDDFAPISVGFSLKYYGH